MYAANQSSITEHMSSSAQRYEDKLGEFNNQVISNNDTKGTGNGVSNGYTANPYALAVAATIDTILTYKHQNTNSSPSMCAYDKIEMYVQAGKDSDNPILKTIFAINVIANEPQKLSELLNASIRQAFYAPAYSNQYVDIELANTFADVTSGYIEGAIVGGALGSIIKLEGTSKAWTSADKYVGETANAIEAKFPGKVADVNKISYRPDGTILTDFDIELDNTVIQVKAGTAKGLTSQITKTATGTSKEVIGYTPDLNPSSALVKNASKQGIKVFTSLDDLLNYLK